MKHSTPNMHYGAIFQPDIPKTWQECFYTTLYVVSTTCHYLGRDELSGAVFGGEAVVFVLSVALHHEVELQKEGCLLDHMITTTRI